MEDKTWQFVDKSKWPDGIWASEPDKVQWTDIATGLPCLAVRHGELGHWCGYVGVGKAHPYYGVHYEEVPIDVHGGVTFTENCDGTEHGVCHLVGPDEEDNLWWIGFDFAHSGDESPGTLVRHADFNRRFPELAYAPRFGEHYWTLPEVQAECAHAAEQINAHK